MNSLSKTIFRAKEFYLPAQSNQYRFTIDLNDLSFILRCKRLKIKCILALHKIAKRISVNML